MNTICRSHDSERAPRVFVVHDHMLEPMFDGIVQDLEAHGVEILRGPASRAGDTPGVLPPAFMSTLQQSDIAMFSSRAVCDATMLTACAPRLRAVINPTIGVETVDLASATELGILVGNGATPENYLGMAESAMMFMLNLFLNLRTTERHLRENKPRPAPDKVHARTLRGKTIGILGLGNIGRSIVDMLAPFGVEVLAFSPRADASTVPPGVEMTGLDDLMARADLVCVCIAVTPENRQLVNERTLGLMKPSAYLVNIARGDAVDEPALIRTLQDCRIAGAALDTYVHEPLPMDSPLRQLDNVILTPHAVGYTKETVDSLRRAALENIRRVVIGLPPLYCKNPSAIARWNTRISSMDRLRGWRQAMREVIA
ncbi:NAD(P)-dependent oxidoreductase [Variovorax ginsengisoli]|uniref:NAD(P)-dependent oxidoreductase n=1 Tax=Variovorax ginsengisoli TaxID=363844 RepID=A0ABT8SCQ1_9BURK|nr:NAD(P)-dependent oxidoreductase [Variovorax ginsengisoli]MDN8617513.1 NAD(P)-dependent oxidoreductase [Variovorax ginsengisoli]MDO1536683.1 NAD(P)-dependent oxidoreductase [Variovorax ginsengisoli]